MARTELFFIKRGYGYAYVLLFTAGVSEPKIDKLYVVVFHHF